MGSNSQTTNSSQSSEFAPWAQTIPGLTNIVNQLSNGGAPTTGAQTSALNTLQAGANATPNYGNTASNAVNGLFNTSTQPQIGLWNNATNTTNQTLSPYLSADYTNPMNTPGFSQALGTLNQDITNQVNGQFAAAGRSDSPGNSQALARGLSQGEGQLIANQYNSLVGQQQSAANQYQTNNANTAQGTAALGQIPIQNQLSGITAAGSLPGLYTAPGATQLTAANTAQQQPYENLQLPTSLLAGIAGLGGTSSGTGTSTTTQPVNPWTTALGAGLGLYALSDERLKEDIEPVGILFNGLTTYKWRFRGDPSRRTHVGVMAQEAEKVRPDAVVDVGLWRGGPSVKLVDYDKVSQPSAMAA